MRNDDIFREISNIAPEMIAEADPNAVALKRKKGKVWRGAALIAACLTLMVAVTVAAFLLPLDRAGEGEVIDKNNLPAELKDYADSEYIDVMLAIYKYNKSQEVTKRPGNILEDLFDYLFSTKANSDNMSPTAPDVEEMNPGASNDDLSGGNKGEYVETTDNQVGGVIEADLFKRSDKYIFYLNIMEQDIRVYSIAGEESVLVGKFKLPFFDTVDEGYGYVSGMQMYLSSDCSTLTVYGNRYGDFINRTDGTKYNVSDLTVLSIDVSDPANMSVKNKVSVKGNCLSSRLVDGKLLLMTNYYLGQTDFSDESSFLPQIDCGEGYESIDAENIIFPETLSGKMYTVVMQMDEKSLEIEGTAAFLSYSDTVYVSADKIFITRGYRINAEGERDGEKVALNKAVSDIYALGYGEGGFEKLGCVTVDGTFKDQYSLDEYEGVLRVVTTTSCRVYPDGIIIKDGVIEYTGKPVSVGRTETNAALYCIDIATWQIVGEVRDFAPDGETVESVRFDGTKAYVCTAVVITFTDPVYFFDLSDMSNITYTDTGVIEGYSSSLVNFGDGLLLGIGFGDSRDTLKIEIYVENEGKVESICSYERIGVDFSTDYKSYFIDREKGMVGLAINDYLHGSNEYILLGFNGYELVELCKDKEEIHLDKHDPPSTRATLIDGYFYILCYSDFRVIKIG